MQGKPQDPFEPEIVIGFVVPDTPEGNQLFQVNRSGFALGPVGAHDEFCEKIHVQFIFVKPAILPTS